MRINDKTSSKVSPEVVSGNGQQDVNISLQALNAAQVAAIDQAMQEIGDFGEVHLIVKRGQLRFIGKFKTVALESETTPK